jgi:hypothetical protein
MKETESYKNWALEELMNYVKSIAEVQTNISYENPPSQITPMKRNENYKNWALEELMNYVKSIAVQTDVSCDNLPNQITPVQDKLVEVTAITTETPQLSDCCPIVPLQIATNEEIALSPSNLKDLVALIEELHLSNGNLVKRVTYLSQSITEFHQDLETYKAQFQVVSSRLNAQNEELAASHETIAAQQSMIEKLTTEIAIAKGLVVQVQADYSEQFDQLAVEKDNCRNLRTRLNREQQHSLQLKVALEKCLEVPAASYQSADDRLGSKDGLEDSASFTPKAPPIKPWTTQIRCVGNQIDLSWERQSNTEVEETKDMQPLATENAIASTEHLDLLNSLMNQDDVEEAIALTDIDEVQVASPIETNQINPRTKSPSPLVYPSRPPKGRKSLAAIELPSFAS